MPEAVVIIFPDATPRPVGADMHGSHGQNDGRTRPPQSQSSAPEASAASRAAPSASDADLLHRLAAGDRQACEALYLRYRPELWDFLGKQDRRLLDEHAAEDVGGEVFRYLWQHRRRLLSVRSFRAYLLGIARNLAARNYHGRHPHTRELPPDAVSPTPPPDAAMERVEFGNQVEDALASLAKSHRQVMELVHDGLSARQIASAVDCTEKAVRRRLAKARSQMRNVLSRCGNACAVDDHRPDECPARKENLYCLKFLYMKRLRPE